MNLAAMALLVPMSTSLLAALLIGRPALQRWVATLGIGVFLVLALSMLARVGESHAPLSTEFGGWPVEAAISFRVDRLSAALIALTAVVGFVTLLFLEAAGGAAPGRERIRPLLCGVLGGASAAFATADLFNLYVWFEWLLVCSLGLLAVAGGRRAIDATFKYLVLNLFATALLLGGVGLLYGLTGQLSFAGLEQAEFASPLLRDAVLGVILLALLAKSAAFPFYAWLPASYPVLPTPVLALCGGLLSKVGIYAILRLMGDTFAGRSALLCEALGWIACATMLAGVLGAVYHYDVRRLLAFHAISQNGYLLLGVALASSAGLAATLFYTVHYVLVKTNLFLIAGLMRAHLGNHDLRRHGGLLSARPDLALLFGVSALSLVGVPPFSGFWAKLLVVGEAFALGRGAWAALALAASFLTLYSMVKIWIEAFWKPVPEAEAPGAGPQGRAPLALACAWTLTALTLWIGLAPQTLLEFSRAAAQSLGQAGAP